jgi:RNA polymerase sigma factor (sigma-70 family)
MNDEEWLAQRFEENRARLRGVAYRLLGSSSEADDALQDAWLRVSRSGAGDVENLAGWLTTVVARVSLNRLRARKRRREAPFEASLPDPVVGPFTTDLAPEEEAILADSVGLALLVVLETLSPAERLAFVLHDTFELPFEEIAPMLGRSPEAARQLASRARRRIRGAAVSEPDTDLSRQRVVVDAFFRAARDGDFGALLALLDPDAVLRADYGPRRAPAIFRGAQAVAEQSRDIPGAEIRLALVNGAAGAVILVRGRPYAVMGFVIRGGQIVEIDAIADPVRVMRIAAGVVES